MQKQLIGLAIAFAALSLVFGIAQRIWPSVHGQRTFRRGFLTDCIYWLATPVTTRVITPLAVALALMPLAVLHGTSLKGLLHGYGRLAAQPLALQGAEIFVLGDFLGYWQHRLFHGRSLWPFHAIHHSSTDLDWLSSVRLHPVNDVVSRLIVCGAACCRGI
jgi:sterol desaturase/sphingolipid hydroxylase (fatty acid hydroxylase superfamily)